MDDESKKTDTSLKLYSHHSINPSFVNDDSEKNQTAVWKSYQEKQKTSMDSEGDEITKKGKMIMQSEEDRLDQIRGMFNKDVQIQNFRVNTTQDSGSKKNLQNNNFFSFRSSNMVLSKNFKGPESFVHLPKAPEDQYTAHRQIPLSSYKRSEPQFGNYGSN